MGLRETAAADLRAIHADAESAQWPVTITDPLGATAVLQCFTTDIELAMSLDTGATVSGRLAEVSINIADLSDAGLGIPEAIEDASRKPWIVEFDDINGNPYKFSVEQSSPDRTIGEVVCMLGVYK